jgi:hypothetical protein
MSTTRSRIFAGIRIALAAVGLVVLVVMVRAIGVGELARVIAPALSWLPVVALLEGVRIGCDAVSTRLVLGARGRAIPFRALYAAQVAAHGVMNVAPAGRTASEAVKAMLLEPWLGGAPALAMGVTNQANVLISSALFSTLCIAGAFSATDPALLATVLGAHAAALLAAGVGLRLLATNRPVTARFIRTFPRSKRALARFNVASRDTRVVAAGPIAAMLAGRAVQTVEYAILAYSVGIAVGPLEALAVQGVNLVAAVLGTVVPGQLGSSEAAFALAASVLGTSVAQATAIALLSHAVQLAWVGAGLVVLAAFRARAAR